MYRLCWFVLWLASFAAVVPAETSVGIFIDAADEPAFAFEPEYSMQYSADDLVFEGSSKAVITLVPEMERLDDVQVGAKAIATYGLSPTAKLIFDVAYDFDRDFDADFSPRFAAIDSTHRFSGNVSFETMIGNARLTLDAGASALVHENLQRIGISDFDRGAQDYIEPEVAMRVAFPATGPVRPFVEAAYVRRSYFEESDLLGRQRGFGGPEFIAGVEIETARVSAQIAAIWAWRNQDEAGVGETSIFGPYVDLTWRPDDRSEVIFAAASSLVQESNGDVSVYPVHAMHIEAKTGLTELWELGAITDIKYEDVAGAGGTLTVTPEVTATWNVQNNIAVIGGIGGEWTKVTGAKGEFSASAKVGFRIGL